MTNNKQQTLEETAEIFVNNRFTKQINGDKFYPDIYASKESIVESHILFAKWQAKEMHKKEMIEFAQSYAVIHCMGDITKNAYEYYNETYGGNK
jgi:hypothetical protein